MPTAMIMRGTMIGDSTNASISDLPRICPRTSRKAAGVPISMAQHRSSEADAERPQGGRHPQRRVDEVLIVLQRKSATAAS